MPYPNDLIILLGRYLSPRKVYDLFTIAKIDKSKIQYYGCVDCVSEKNSSDSYETKYYISKYNPHNKKVNKGIYIENLKSIRKLILDAYYRSKEINLFGLDNLKKITITHGSDLKLINLEKLEKLKTFIINTSSGSDLTLPSSLQKLKVCKEFKKKINFRDLVNLKILDLESSPHMEEKFSVSNMKKLLEKSEIFIKNIRDDLNNLINLKILILGENVSVDYNLSNLTKLKKLKLNYNIFWNKDTITLPKNLEILFFGDRYNRDIYKIGEQCPNLKRIVCFYPHQESYIHDPPKDCKIVRSDQYYEKMFENLVE